MYINQYKPDVHKSREYTDLKSTNKVMQAFKFWGVKFADIQEFRMCYHTVTFAMSSEMFYHMSNKI